MRYLLNQQMNELQAQELTLEIYQQNILCLKIDYFVE